MKQIVAVLILVFCGLNQLLSGAEKEAARKEALEAISGTWALQQVSTTAELGRLAPTINPALDTPGLRGFCLRVPWKSIDRDFSVLEAGLKMAKQHQLAFSLRFMAGRHTPEHVFKPTTPFYLKGKEKVPTPFKPDGSPNTDFEEAYENLVAKLAAWCRSNHVHLLHLAWYGQDWAELNHGKDVRAAKGYSFENWVRAHERLIDIGLKYAGEDLTVELPFSGHGPCTDASAEFADHVIKKIGPWNPRFFCQANGWVLRGDWGAPTPEVEASFDKIWAKPICRGQQAIQPGDYDWTVVFKKLYDNNATYCEVYVPSFSKEHRAQLAKEIKAFAARPKTGGAP